jgi:hypothetical protein
MGLLDRIKNLFQGPDRGHGVEELARRLSTTVEALKKVPCSYREFGIPKKGGGTRPIAAPIPELKTLQRKVLRLLLARLRSHVVATGFERRHSIVTNAQCHARKAVVVRLDVKDFFGSTKAERVGDYFRTVGWNREASDLLVRICTRDGSLPQGAPTSPRLSNLVNYRLDARMEAMALAHGAVYTRYADDLTFSFEADDGAAVRRVIRAARGIAASVGYLLHGKKKQRIRRRHDRQIVTGLVVNDGVRLPRETRRWLRSVEHRLSKRRAATLTRAQLDGWRAFARMVEAQSRPR